jgi:nucleoside-diphosphate-sugar epimerase
MAYGNFQTETVTEEHPLESIGIYGALKVAGEKLVVAYNQVFDLPYTIVRPSALYGPRCVSRRVAQIFVENALLGEPLQICGNGEERLDFTFVDDLVDGIAALILNEKAFGQVFNLTNGRAQSVNELLEVVRREIPEVDVRYEPKDRLQPERGTLSIEKARAAFGYNPRNPIDVGIPKYIAWCRRFMEEHHIQS